jgi:HD-like signal output (HDOD) protein
MNKLVQHIVNIPALSQTVIDTLNFSLKSEKSAEELIKIIGNDPLITIMLLKTANSAIYGFVNKVDSVENLIYLLGIDFTIALILSNSLQNNFDVNFAPYGIDANKFRFNISLKSNLLKLWINKFDIEVAKKLHLSVILYDLGKYLIAAHIISEKKTDQFLKSINENISNIESIEREYCGVSSKEATILLLKHWNLNQSIIDNLDGTNKTLSVILEIIHTICSIVKPLDDSFVEEGLTKASLHHLKSEVLKQSVTKLIDMIDENEI